MAGAATVGLEILEQVSDVEAVVVPIGGGGLLAGIAAAIRQTNPQVRLVGVEPEGAASMRKSLEAGHPVPTAINLVGREMSDPVGTEFGMAADEIAYGSTMQEAIGRNAVVVVGSARLPAPSRTEPTAVPPLPSGRTWRESAAP